MKKWIFLVLIFLGGCTSSYNLTFDDNNITEKIMVELPNTSDNKEAVLRDFYPLHMNNNVVYNKDIKYVDDIIKLDLNYTYTSKDFINSDLLNLCFRYKDIDIDNDSYYYLKLSQFFPCVTAKEFDINIITNNKVLVNNADKISGNKYIWHITEENRDSFMLEIKIAKGVKANNYSNMLIYIFLGAFVIFIIFMVIFLKKSNKRNII